MSNTQRDLFWSEWVREKSEEVEADFKFRRPDGSRIVLTSEKYVGRAGLCGHRRRRPEVYET